ncbi:unnamed protein product [Trichobilharzia szidati]|nr:unnamed protein product [Trichobilharzia szidati]
MFISKYFEMKVVGVLMSDAKVRSIGLDYLLNSERDALQFKKIDPLIDISEQGQFDVILHKIPEFLRCDTSILGRQIVENFTNYIETNPHIICIDPPHSLKRLLTRFDQFRLLKVILDALNINNRIFVPNFCILSQNDPTTLLNADISYPIICKSLMAHGEDSVHKMAVVFNNSGLDSLTYPVFAQQFIKHTGKVLKLFVIGDHTCVTEVPSIKNHNKSSDKSPIFFHSHSVSKEGCKSPLSDPCSLFDKQSVCTYDNVLFNLLAAEIRKTLEIDLFGVDLICEAENSTPDSPTEPARYAIIDINIFPSYKNVHGFIFHLENLIRKKLSLPLLSINNNNNGSNGVE